MRRLASTTTTVLFVLLAAGCAPYLRYEMRSVAAYASSERCAQGPFELRVPLEGARWSEQVRVVLYTPRAIEGHYELVLGDGLERVGGRFGPGRTRFVPRLSATHDVTAWSREWTAADAPDNAVCLPDASDGAAAGTAVVRAGDDPAGAGAARAGDAVAMEAKPVTWVAAPWPSIDHQLPPAEAHRLELGVIELGSLVTSHAAPYAAEAQAVPPGTEVVVRLWSERPNNLEGVRLVVEHGVHRPNVSDEAWAAHLEEERRERAREDRARAREAERRRAEWARREAWCHAHLDDRGCWGEGGHAGHVARQREAARAAEARRAALAAEPPPPPAPDGPPPPPRAETRPPPPSPNAAWIAGHWRWHVARWVWSAGFWRVPEADLAAGRTAEAPAPPPPARPEATPPEPAPRMVWTPGYWAWDGAAWIWVEGAWRLPPDDGATWQPPEWRPRGRGVVLQPGGWRITVRAPGR